MCFHFSVIDCKPLTPIPFGVIKYTKNTTYLGSEVSYSCANTHRLNGISRRTCLESGQWSDAAPKCEEIRCPEPVLAMHSILSVTGNDRMYGRTLIRSHQDSSSSIQTYKVGALAKYRCERGYKIIGDPLITCEENGAWGGKVPDCVCKCCQWNNLIIIFTLMFTCRCWLPKSAFHRQRNCSAINQCDILRSRCSLRMLRQLQARRCFETIMLRRWNLGTWYSSLCGSHLPSSRCERTSHCRCWQEISEGSRQVLVHKGKIFGWQQHETVFS